jgi:peptide/nickel transport system substrate-binding protein
MLLSTLLVACSNSPATTTSGTTSTTSAPTSTTKAPSATTKAPATTTAASDKHGGIYKSAMTVAPARPFGYPAEGSGDSFDVAIPCLDRLVRTRADGSIEPRLAVDWKVASDYKSITIGLRKGVKFHDGSDFNADVCKWNLDLIIAAKQSAASTWNSIDKIDDYTIRINLERYQNTVLTGLASGATQQISKASFDKNGIEWCRWHPVGTGPFTFVSYERDAKLTFKRNPNYWDPPKPYLDGIERTIIADATVRKLAFQKGDIFRFAPQLVDAKEMMAKYPYLTSAGNPYVLVPDSMNSKSPWADIRVRYAASYALDRESLAQALGFGLALPAYQLMQGLPDTKIPDLVPTTYSPVKAKSLLKEAGYPNGFKTYIHAFTRIVPENYVSAIAGQLREVGVNVELDLPTSGKYEEMRYGTWEGLMGHSFRAGENRNQLFTLYFTGLQFGHCKKPAGWWEGVNASLASIEPDPKLIKAVLQIMYDDMMVISYMEPAIVDLTLQGVNDPKAVEYPPQYSPPEEIWLDKSLR